MFSEMYDLSAGDYPEDLSALSMTPPDEIIDEDAPAAVKQTGTITIESKELFHMMDVLGAVHAVLVEGKPFPLLERSYETYTLYCDGRPAPNRGEKYEREIAAHLGRLQKAIQEAGPVIKKLDFHKSLQRKWGVLESTAAKVDENLQAFMASRAAR